MGQKQCFEIIIRGDLLLRQVIRKLGEQLQKTDIEADFSSTIIVPAWRTAMKLQRPSLGILHAEVNAKDVYRFEAILQELIETEQCHLISIDKLEKR